MDDKIYELPWLDQDISWSAESCCENKTETDKQTTLKKSFENNYSNCEFAKGSQFWPKSHETFKAFSTDAKYFARIKISELRKTVLIL